MSVCSFVPMPKRMDEWARSSSVPRARRTYEGSREDDVQAEPDERAMSLSAIRSDSTSTNANDRLTQPGYPLTESPLRMTWGNLAEMPLTSRSDSFRILAASRAISSFAVWQAAPRPTTSGVGTVPDRMPRSCPPPEMSASMRTRGRRRM